MTQLNDTLFDNAQAITHIGLYNNNLKSIEAHKALTQLVQLLLQDNQLSQTVTILSRSTNFATLLLANNNIQKLDLTLNSPLDTLCVRNNTSLRSMSCNMEILRLDIGYTMFDPADHRLCTVFGTHELNAEKVVNLQEWNLNMPQFLLRCFNVPPIVDHLVLTGHTVPLSALRAALDRPYSIEHLEGPYYFSDVSDSEDANSSCPVENLPYFILGSSSLVQCTPDIYISSVYTETDSHDEQWLNQFVGIIQAARYKCSCITGYTEDDDQNCWASPSKPEFRQTAGGKAAIAILSVTAGCSLLYIAFSGLRKVRRKYTGLQQANQQLQKKVEALKATWKISESALQWGPQLGEGGYGEVCRAQFLVADIGDVAVKRLKSMELDNEEVRRQLATALEKEADFLIKVDWRRGIGREVWGMGRRKIMESI